MELINCITANWYISCDVDSGEPVPTNITDARSAARVAIITGDT